MGTIINSIAIEKSEGRNGIVQLISSAANKCLAKAGVLIDNVGMLINTGVYSENHIIEPALATLVHKQLLRKNETINTCSERLGKLFSFDLHNGGGGIINAIQVIDSFIQTNEIEHGLIVSGDIKPKTGITDNYNLTASAAAILVSAKNSKPGFVCYKTETFPEFKNDFCSSTKWVNGSLMFANKQSDTYLKNTIGCTEKVLNIFFEEEYLSWDEIDFVFTSQSPVGFASELQKKLKIKGKIIQLNEKQEIYSSGLLFSMNQIFNHKKFNEAKSLLFVTVGAGITVSVAYYKNH